MGLPKWLGVVLEFTPLILRTTPLAPIADDVAIGIAKAQMIPGASGPQKLTHVVDIAVASADARNKQAGREVVDLEAVRQNAATVISAVVQTVHNIQAARGDAPVPTTTNGLPPAAPAELHAVTMAPNHPSLEAPPQYVANVPPVPTQGTPASAEPQVPA